MISPGTLLKTCFKCGAERPLTEFYRHPNMSDGYLNKCKPCTRSDVSQNREKNIAHFREYDRRRYRLSDARKRQLRGLFESADPRRLKANYTLSNAVRDGRIKRAEACWHCGSTERVEGHHVHYDLPLDVVWLCRSCHCKVHRMNHHD